MKKIYSFSLNGKLIDSLDVICRKTGHSRSELITKLLVEHINNGVDPEVVTTENIQATKNIIIRKILTMYKTMPELGEFISKFSLELSLNHDETAILFSAENRKFFCEIKSVADSIKISAKVESSSKRAYGVFEEAYDKNRIVLEEQGYRRYIFQRYWRLEYRYEIKEYPEGDEIDTLAGYLLRKFLLLYTNFLINIDYIVDNEEARCIIQKTDALNSFDSQYSHINPPYLQVVTGAMRGNRYKLENGYAILGRNGVDINLFEQELNMKKPVVSKKHAAISIRDNRFFIKDLGSTNGTRINSLSVNPIDSEYELKDGDCFFIADIELKLIAR